jgi:hypothetical protein
MAVQTASTVRAAAAFRNRCLSLANTCSIGLRSGEYFGRKISLAPTERMSRRTALRLWLPRLSRDEAWEAEPSRRRFGSSRRRPGLREAKEHRSGRNAALPRRSWCSSGRRELWREVASRAVPSPAVAPCWSWSSLVDEVSGRYYHRGQLHRTHQFLELPVQSR